jgi:glycosyltransferase A (GT-A) superfamily protein (DUF2064 family)
MQLGFDFGSRLQNAITDVFDLGYKNVTVVGNDCIDIKKDDLLRAQSQLKHGFHTIGKTVNGGVYLFTVSKETFSKESFENLSWSQETLASELFSWLTSFSKVCLLETKRDINSYRELLHWTTFTKHQLGAILKDIISYFNQEFTTLRFVISIFYRNLQLQRGPPSE